MKKSVVLTIVCGSLMAAAALSLTGCAKKEENKKITFVLDWTPNTNHTGLYVAQEKGYFTEEGLAVDIVQPPEDGAPLMVASGKAQLGIDAQGTLAAAWASDSPIPVTAVAALLQHNTSGIISLKSKGIDHPAALCGHSYATWNNPEELAVMKNIVENDGGDFSKVTLIPSNVEDVVTALSSNTVDSVWIFYGWDGIATQLKGLETNFLDFSKLNPVFDEYTPLMIANDDFLKNDPEAAKKFMRAAKRGYEYAAAHPDEAADILCKYAPELDSSMVHASQKWIGSQYKADAAVWGYITPERWNAFYTWLYDTKLISKPLTDTPHFTNDYLDK